MKRFLNRFAIGSALVAALSVVGISYTAVAAPPVGCTFPNGYDYLDALKDRNSLTAEIINQWQCLLNALQQRALYEGLREHICEPVSVPAGKRISVPLTLSMTTPADSPIFVMAADSSSPARLEAGIEQPSGSTAVAWVFNHDPANTRTGRVCAQLIRF